MARPISEAKLGWSMLLSIAVHVAIFALLFFTISHSKPTPPIMVNLLKDAKPEQNIIKAGIVDRRAIDQAIQRQANEERLKQEKILQQQQKSEQLKVEAEQAKKALELATQQKALLEIATKKAAEEKVRLDKEIANKKALAKEQQAKEQVAKETAAKKLQANKAPPKNEIAKKAVVDPKIAALKAEKDRLAAEHTALLETEVDKYKAEFAAAIKENKIVSSIFAKEMRCTIRIKLLPDGSIVAVHVAESSGNRAFDDMQISAVHKTAPFPMPADSELYEQLRDLVLSLSNDEELSNG
jgi:colicin import membrane protein